MVRQIAERSEWFRVMVIDMPGQNNRKVRIDKLFFHFPYPLLDQSDPFLMDNRPGQFRHSRARFRRVHPVGHDGCFRASRDDIEI